MIIFEDSQLQVLYTEHPSDYLLITFAHAALRANNHRYFGANLTVQRKIATLGFVARQPNWYPAAHMESAIAAAQPILTRFSEKVTLGYSMGGYAAIKFARQLQSDLTISLCPQYSMEASDMPPAFHEPLRNALVALKVREGDISRGMRINSDSGAGRVFVFYDNKDPAEATNLARIESCVALTKISMPYTRHTTIRCFPDAAALNSLVELCREGDESKIRAFAFRQRKPASNRAQNLAAALADRHFRWAAAVFDRYGGALDFKEKAALTNLLAKKALQHGTIDWAVAALQKAIANGDCDDATHQLLIDAHLHLGEDEIAAEALRARVAQAPKDAVLHDKLLATLLRLPDLPAAQAASARALAEFPDHPKVLHHASEIAVRSGDLAQAIRYAADASHHDRGAPVRMERVGALMLRADRLDEAEAWFNDMLALAPEHVGALRGLVKIYARRKARIANKAAQPAAPVPAPEPSPAPRLIYVTAAPEPSTDCDATPSDSGRYAA